MDLQDIRERLEDFSSGKLTAAERERLHDVLSGLSEEECARLFPEDGFLHRGAFQLPETTKAAALHRLKHTVKLSSKTVFFTSSVKVSRYAAALVLLIGSVFLLSKHARLFYRDRDYNVKRFCTMVVPDGNQGTLILKDGTRIVMNGGSELRYPENFDGVERIVHLDSGEAYFDITKDPAHPFIVTTPQVKVRVLGTSFSVRDYRDEQQVSVSVNSGKVALENLLSMMPWVELMAGSGSVIDKQKGTITKRDIDTSAATAWTRGEFAFQDVDLEQILQVLQHRYAVRFDVKYPDLSKRRFTATFRHNSLPDIMQQLELMGGIRYTITGNLITIQ